MVSVVYLDQQTETHMYENLIKTQPVYLDVTVRNYPQKFGTGDNAVHLNYLKQEVVITQRIDPGTVLKFSFLINKMMADEYTELPATHPLAEEREKNIVTLRKSNIDVYEAYLKALQEKEFRIKRGILRIAVDDKE